MPGDLDEGVAQRLVMYLAAEGMAADPATVGRWGEIARAVRAAGDGSAQR